MTTPHTPPTQAELDGLKARYSANIASSALIRRLVREVERLRIDNELLRNGARVNEGALLAENEKLRKDKERFVGALKLIEIRDDGRVVWEHFHVAMIL
jgi:hypothetical protein